MFKNLFRIPDTFDPDERRRRQVLNVILIFFLVMILVVFFIILLAYCNCTYLSYEELGKGLFVSTPLSFIFVIVLLFMNRSPRVPSWLSGGIFIISLIITLSFSDTPYELYNGRSIVAWVIPILLATIIFPPRYGFLVTILICGLMQAFTPPNGHNTNPVNYFTMIELVIITFISWLGMSIANNAIRDARREAANNKAILENMGEGLLVLDLQGKFLSANPALLRMIPREDLQEIVAKPLGKNMQWKRKIYSLTASAVPEVGTVAVFRDDTRRHETERARDALLATASHELRTPLAATMNYLELMLMMIKVDKVKMDAFKEHLTRALENSKRLQILVNNILDQAQIQAGMLELKNQLFDLPALLERTRQLLETLLKEKNLSYELILDPNIPLEMNGDPERLYQVLVNLIGNAIKFTNQGGIKVKVYKSQKEKLSIEVADSGAGIPPEQLPDIFEAFRRGSNYAQRERQGAGLGLSIAKEIVTRMGGEISAASHFGTGSTFTVTLPIQAP